VAAAALIFAFDRTIPSLPYFGNIFSQPMLPATG